MIPAHAVEAQRLAEQLRARGDLGDEPEALFEMGEPQEAGDAS